MARVAISHRLCCATPVRLDVCGWAGRMSPGEFCCLQRPPLGVLAVRTGADMQVHVPRIPAMCVTSLHDMLHAAGCPVIQPT